MNQLTKRPTDKWLQSESNWRNNSNETLEQYMSHIKDKNDDSRSNFIYKMQIYDKYDEFQVWLLLNICIWFATNVRTVPKTE